MLVSTALFNTDNDFLPERPLTDPIILADEILMRPYQSSCNAHPLLQSICTTPI
ncbi:hypothetical protein F0726_01024 [Acidithiobacillus caldus]|nr:hypothetical protein F0726_01024 [Acidithiobacillus caldus]